MSAGFFIAFKVVFPQAFGEEFAALVEDNLKVRIMLMGEVCQHIDVIAH